MAHVDLNSKYVESGDAYIVRFRAFEARTGIDSRQQLGAHIDLASDSELDQLVEAIGRHRPQAYLDGLDLVRERLDLRATKRLWRGVRLERERIILVARRCGIATAAAILELGAEGAHIYGLLDLARFFPLVPGGETAFSDLLATAKSWYEEQGRQKFTCFFEEGLPAIEPQRNQLADLGEADLVLLAAHRMPDWLEQVHLVTAPRAIAP